MLIFCIFAPYLNRIVVKGCFVRMVRVLYHNSNSEIIRASRLSTNYNCLSSSLTSIIPFRRLNVVFRLYKYGGILKWDSLWCYFLFIRPSAVQMKLAERGGTLNENWSAQKMQWIWNRIDYCCRFTETPILINILINQSGRKGPSFAFNKVFYWFYFSIKFVEYFSSNLWKEMNKKEERPGNYLNLSVAGTLLNPTKHCSDRNGRPDIRKI